MFSFTTLLILFLMGLLGLGLAIYGILPDQWILLSAGLGLMAWFLCAILMFVDRTIGMIHHLKRSHAIDKDLKREILEEKNQVIQRGSSEAKKRARSKRLKLWVNTIAGKRD